MKHLLFTLLTIGYCWANKNSTNRYDNHRVYRVLPNNLQQLKAILNLEASGYQFWSEPNSINPYVDVIVSPDQLLHFEQVLETLNLMPNVTIENIQRLIDQEKINIPRSSNFNWKGYHTLSQINSWMKSLEKQYPGVVELVKGGRSNENRIIYGVYVSFKPAQKAVFLEGGIHAREWISPATVTYILNELLTSKDIKVRSVAESHDWYIFPVFNPDGYEYSHKKDRLWRKTRRPNGFCFGTDLNRNWGYHWMDGGASSSACSEIYAGPSAFSDIEAKSLSNYITHIAPKLDAYISFHSFSQLLLIPFGHKGRETPSNNKELHEIGQLAIKKLSQRYGTKYFVGNIPQIIYISSGGSCDWVAGVHKVRMVYTFELRDTGRYGFILPSKYIIPTGKETLDAIVVMIDELNKRMG